MQNYDEDNDLPCFASEVDQLKYGMVNEEDSDLEKLSDDEKEDYTVKKSDSMLVTAKIVLIN